MKAGLRHPQAPGRYNEDYVSLSALVTILAILAGAWLWNWMTNHWRFLVALLLASGFGVGVWTLGTWLGLNP